MTAPERFRAAVIERGPDDCWEWTGSRHPQGYGMFSVNGRNIYAHRFSAMLHFGMFDRRSRVMHSCDNPGCVNPAHLSLGTQRDNMLDCSAKGRNPMQRRQECPQGHPYDTTVPSHGGVARRCRRCAAEASRRYRERRADS